MNANALSRAKSILAELRTLLPDKATQLDVIADRLKGKNRDGLQVHISAQVSLIPQDERTSVCR